VQHAAEDAASYIVKPSDYLTERLICGRELNFNRADICATRDGRVPVVGITIDGTCRNAQYGSQEQTLAHVEGPDYRYRRNASIIAVDATVATAPCRCRPDADGTASNHV